ncbi:UPF0125 protein RatB [hydrothermal vent metagenome]|uniref:UPF0125 protein RatB n=1 Tax=hydrothermal vent metagenome TaxID=652676 RepID=A0A3B1BLK9_9ZZZZ
MNVGVVYAKATKQVWLQLDVPEGSTVQQAIEISGLLDQFPEIDLGKQKVGIFGKMTKLDNIVEEGQRIEIYRPIVADPEMVERRD